MSPKVLVPLAEGFETIEALAVVDVFRRAEVEVVTAAVGRSRQVKSSHDVKVVADRMLVDCLEEEWSLIVLPGGVVGSENLSRSSQVVNLLKKQNAENKLYGAICAAPAVVLEEHGLLEGKKATCHPGFIARIAAEKQEGGGVVVAGNCITGRGAGWSVHFALEMLEKLEGKMKREEVEKGLALP